MVAVASYRLAPGIRYMDKQFMQTKQIIPDTFLKGSKERWDEDRKLFNNYTACIDYSKSLWNRKKITTFEHESNEEEKTREIWENSQIHKKSQTNKANKDFL